MRRDWGQVCLGEVSEIIMGQSPPGSTYNENGDGLPFFQGVKDFGYRYPTPRVFCSQPSRVAQPGDILFSVRAPIGRVNVADKECAIGRGLAIIRPRNRDDARYIELALRYLEPTWHAVEGGGSVFGNATRKDLELLPLPWPKTSERRGIADILGAFDDKIEVNARMNRTLEAMVQLIFNAWFVDFDPVVAKMEGRWCQDQSLPGLPAHLWHLFPDRLVASELGDIPAGWKVGPVGEEFTVAMGQSPPGETYNEAGEGLPFYQGRADFGFRFPIRRMFCTAPTRYADPGDTLVSVRAPVGDVNMALERCCIGRGLAAVRHKSRSQSYTYYFMRSMKRVLNGFDANGTVFGAITKEDFLGIRHVIPPAEIIRGFDQIVGPMDNRIEQNERESRTLAQLRDMLLPKLLSGTLRVKDVNTFIKESGL